MTRTPPSARWLLAAALASILPASPAVLAQAAEPPAPVRLPSLGDASAEDFNVGTERRLGEQIMDEVRRDPAYLDDPLLLDHVLALWAPLLDAARARGHVGADLDSGFAWEAFLVRDRAVNAFALPGGYVGVYLGLIALTSTRDELASVLAHELSHVSQRHIARSVAAASRQSLVGMAAIILGALAASRSNSSSADNATQAIIAGGQAALIQQQLNFSRDMEREADRIGFGVHQQAGFAAPGMAAMFERLDQANRLTDNGAFPYLRSHPLTVDRIGEARARVEAQPGTRAPLTPTLDHLLMQARARVLMEPSVQSLRRWQAHDGAGAAAAERLAALYGSALASLELREPARAQTALDAASALRDAAGLAQNAAARRAVTLVQAQTWVAAGEPQRALALLDAGPAPTSLRGDRRRPLLLARADAAIAAARTGDRASLRASQEDLQTWVAEHRADAGAWRALATAAELQGQPLRALRAQAEVQAALGDLGGAIDRLRAAQREARAPGVAPDFVESSVIDARLRELVARRRAQMAEQRGEREPR